MKTTLVLVFMVFTTVLAAPNWNDLRTTFGIAPFSKVFFAQQPRDLNQDTKGFVLKDDMCNGSNLFVGKRYWIDNDPALILIFDINGYIAGIQTAVDKATGYKPVAPMLGTYILDEGTYYTQTVYFVDPKIICSPGRSATDFANQGTGTDLYIQMGPSPTTDLFVVPMNEYDIKGTKWGYGKCFYMMGQHYWYNLTLDMSCDNLVPYCLLYNGGVLNAFCFAIDYNVKPSDRYEHPTPLAAQGFMDPVPKCLSGTQSTLHVYTTSNYIADRC